MKKVTQKYSSTASAFWSSEKIDDAGTCKNYVLTGDKKYSFLQTQTVTLVQKMIVTRECTKELVGMTILLRKICF